ncbi:MAG: hypothetical protein U0Q12_27660 [Vicinamibacterales bacterium]
MRSSFISVLVLAVGLASMTMAAAVQSLPSGGTDLSGTWLLNKDLSKGPLPGSTPEGDGPPGRGGRRPPGGFGGPGGGMGGPGGGGMGGFGRRGGGPGGGPGGPGERERPSEEEMKARRELMREVVQAPVRMTIAQDGALVTFIDDDGHARKYEADGQAEKHQLTNGVVETRTRWEATSLVVDTLVDGRMHVVRTYELADVQLVVTTRFDGRGGRGARGGGPGGRGDRDGRGERESPGARSVYDRVD